MIASMMATKSQMDAVPVKLAPWKVVQIALQVVCITTTASVTNVGRESARKDLIQIARIIAALMMARSTQVVNQLQQMARMIHADLTCMYCSQQNPSKAVHGNQYHLSQEPGQCPQTFLARRHAPPHKARWVRWGRLLLAAWMPWIRESKSTRASPADLACQRSHTIL
jgi:hypothetical protein